jgi:hypothetical protein
VLFTKLLFATVVSARLNPVIEPEAIEVPTMALSPIWPELTAPLLR